MLFGTYYDKTHNLYIMKLLWFWLLSSGVSHRKFGWSRQANCLFLQLMIHQPTKRMREVHEFPNRHSSCAKRLYRPSHEGALTGIKCGKTHIPQYVCFPNRRSYLHQVALQTASPKLYLTLGTAKVERGRGVKINYLYYFSKAFDSQKVQGTQVFVRYDPFNIGLAYAYVEGRWVKCLSEYHLRLRGHSERELQFASTELRKRYQNHRGEAAITARRLADLLAKASDYETVLIQRLCDLEARDVFARMHGSHLAWDVEEQTPPTLTSSSTAPEDQREDVPVGRKEALSPDDDEELDEYEDYR
jgi:hypothetical protein